MRIVQLIDSLQSGGAERMTVNLANVFNEAGYKSVLVVSRTTGNMESLIDNNIDVKFLNKRSFADILAFWKLYKLIKSDEKCVVHAHATSIFWGSILKLLLPKIILIWHDHYGSINTEGLDNRKITILFAKKSDGVISVNEGLRLWAINSLNKPENKVVYMRNFPMLKFGRSSKRNIFTIVQLANFRAAKDHFTALEAFKILRDKGYKFQVLWAGLLSEEVYVNELKEKLSEYKLINMVRFLGEVTNVENLLNTSHLGLLSSASEGLPVSLLEYGLAGLPVVCTNVGQCNDVIISEEFGYLVSPRSSSIMAEKIEKIYLNYEVELQKGMNLKERVLDEFGAKKFLKEYKKLLLELVPN